MPPTDTLRNELTILLKKYAFQIQLQLHYKDLGHTNIKQCRLGIVVTRGNFFNGQVISPALSICTKYCSPFVRLIMDSDKEQTELNLLYV